MFKVSLQYHISLHCHSYTKLSQSVTDQQSPAKSKRDRLEAVDLDQVVGISQVPHPPTRLARQAATTDATRSP